MFSLRRLDNLPDSFVRLDDSKFPGCPLHPDSVWWGAYGPSGHVAGYTVLEPWTDGIGFLARSWVAPRYRGHRLQRRMIWVRERHARKCGIKRLVSYTADQNCQSANSLIRCGYRTYTPGEAWGTDGCTYWFKVL